MATIVRVKRRRNDDPTDSIIVSCKKLKTDSQEEEDQLKSCLRFAGTVLTKEDVISKHIRNAIRKDKLQKEYKSHQTDISSRSRQNKKQSSKSSRFKVVSSLRSLDLELLDKENEETQKTVVPSEENVSNEKKDNLKLSTTNTEKQTVCNGTERTDNMSMCEKVSSTSGGASLVPSTKTGDKVYQLFDVEIDSQTLPSFESLMQEAQDASSITCNSVPLIHEQVLPENRDQDFVYDLYYTNSRDFNLRLLESSLCIELPNSELELMHNGDELSDSELYEDEDDENDEGNWRNDYPDEDPHFFENNDDDIEDYYGNEMEDYHVFDSGDPGLSEWMSTRCNIEDEDEESSEGGEEPQEADLSSYERYCQRVRKKLGSEDIFIPK